MRWPSSFGWLSSGLIRNSGAFRHREGGKRLGHGRSARDGGLLDPVVDRHERVEETESRHHAVDQQMDADPA
jgi:hypothetical protein